MVFNFRKWPFWLAILLSIAATSCSTEAKLASISSERLQNASYLVLFPDYLLFTNSKTYPFDDSLTENQLYFASLDSSLFLKSYVDSVLLKSFADQSFSFLENVGLKVYKSDSLEAFLKKSGRKFIFDFTQLQLEEMLVLHTDQETMPDEMTYTQEFYINALAFNSWITVSEMLDTALRRDFIFSECVKKDVIKGVFMMNNLNGEVYYEYTYKPIQVGDIDEIMFESVQKANLDLLDFLVNNELEKRMVHYTGRYPSRFWRYRPSGKKPSPSNQKSGYIIVE